jgi:DNA repair protein RadA/Sms
MAVVSSYKAESTNSTDVFIGEVGLSGEIRSVPQLEERLKEIKKLGFKRAIVPKNNMKRIEPIEGLQVIGVSTLQEAIQQAF